MKGLYIGRFDPFHLGHLRAYDLLMKITNSVQIGIGSQRQNDYFSLEDRKEMVCQNTGIKPLELDDLFEDHPLYWDWGRYVIEKIPDVDIVATGNKYVHDDFSKNNIHVLWLPRYDDISGTLIRRKIKESDDSWKLLVPEKTKEIIIVSKEYKSVRI